MKSQDLELIANQMLEMLENVNGDWEKSWISFANVNLQTQKNYRGLNSLILSIVKMEKHFKSSVWGTFKQWSDKGCHIKKGEKSTRVIFWKPVKFSVEVKDIETDEIKLDEKESFVARFYSVFNADQVEGSEKFTEKYNGTEKQEDEKVNDFFSKIEVPIFFDSDSSFYSPKNHEIHLPDVKYFKDYKSFVSVLSHEAIHSTGKELDRKIENEFGSEEYAFEELVADIGAGFLAGHLGYDYQFSKNNLAYIKSWISIIKNKNESIIKACSLAQNACDYLVNKVEKECE